MGPFRISVIVVSFNTKEQLRRCLACLEPDLEVIVVDNASADGSPDMVEQEFPRVRLIRSDRNLGFSAANNLGAKIATGELWLFLNSDAYAEPGAVARLSEVFTDPTIVGAGGMLLNMDGSLQDSTARRLTLGVVLAEQFGLMKLANRLRPGSCYWSTRLLPKDRISDTPQVMGACLMSRANVEAWDERFFLYCEDTALCLNLARHGRIVYVPQARFTHELGSSSRKNPWLGIARYNAGKELYFRLNHGGLSAIICRGLNLGGAMFRLLVAALTLRSGSVRTWWQVLTYRSKS